MSVVGRGQVVCVSLIVALLMAQTVRAESPDDAVRRILNTPQTRQMILEQSDAFTKPFMKLLFKADKRLDENDADQFAAAVSNAFEARFPEFIELLIPVYRKHFTDDEIKGLAEFHDSPLGRKLVRVQPALGREAMAIGSKWGRRVGEDAAREVLKARRGAELLGQLRKWHAWLVDALPGN